MRTSLFSFQTSMPTKRKLPTPAATANGEATAELPIDGTVAECSRPKGQKLSKVKDANESLTSAGLAIAENGKILANLAKQKLADSLQRTAAYKRMVNHSIMSVDLSKMDSISREYYILEKERILQEARNPSESKMEEFDYASSQAYEEIIEELPIDDAEGVLFSYTTALYSEDEELPESNNEDS